jgi:hypothetical protein
MKRIAACGAEIDVKMVLNYEDKLTPEKNLNFYVAIPFGMRGFYLHRGHLLNERVEHYIFKHFQ